MLLGGVPAGAWAASRLGTATSEWLAVAAACVLGLAAFEVWFRGLVHGLLALDLRTQRPGGPWFLSRAALVSAVVYTVVATFAIDSTPLNRVLGSFGWSGVELLGAALALGFVAGLALAVIRERSLSLWPGLGLQVLGVAAAAVAWRWLA